MKCDECFNKISEWGTIFIKSNPYKFICETCNYSNQYSKFLIDTILSVLIFMIFVMILRGLILDVFTILKGCLGVIILLLMPS